MNLLQLDPMEKKLHPGLAMRYYRYIFQFVLCVFLVCLVLAGASRPGHASLEEDVARKNQELAKQKKQIQALTDKERALHKDLAQLEKTLAQSAALLQQLEKDLDAAKNTGRYSHAFKCCTRPAEQGRRQTGRTYAYLMADLSHCQK